MGLLSSLFSATKHFTIVKPDGFSFNDHVNAAFDPDSTITSLVTVQKILAEYLAKLPLEIYQSSQEAGKLKNKKHRLYRLLHNSPNSYQTSTNFFRQLEFWRNKYGNAWAKIHRSRGGLAEYLEQIHPREMAGYSIKNNELYWLRIKEDGTKETLNNMDVLHFPFISDGGVMGLNPVQILLRELDNIYQGKTTLNHAYRNNLNIEKYFKTGITNFQAKGVKDSIEEIKKEYSGSFSAKKAPFLPAGFELVTVPPGNIQDAQILESLKFSKADIYELFGVPLPERKSYNSIEQESLNFKTNTLQPIARMYRQELEKKLLTDEEIGADVSIEFNLNAMVEADMTTRGTYLKTLHGMGVISSNTVAKMEGFDTYEGGELHFIQSQNIPIEQYEKYAKAGQASPFNQKPNQAPQND